MTVGAAQDVVLGRTTDGADGGGRWFMTLTYCHHNHVPLLFPCRYYVSFDSLLTIMIIIMIATIFLYTSTDPRVKDAINWFHFVFQSPYDF